MEMQGASGFCALLQERSILRNWGSLLASSRKLSSNNQGQHGYCLQWWGSFGDSGSLMSVLCLPKSCAEPAIEVLPHDSQKRPTRGAEVASGKVGFGIQIPQRHGNLHVQERSFIGPGLAALERSAELAMRIISTPKPQACCFSVWTCVTKEIP